LVAVWRRSLALQAQRQTESNAAVWMEFSSLRALRSVYGLDYRSFLLLRLRQSDDDERALCAGCGVDIDREDVQSVVDHDHDLHLKMLEALADSEVAQDRMRKDVADELKRSRPVSADEYEELRLRYRAALGIKGRGKWTSYRASTLRYRQATRKSLRCLLCRACNALEGSIRKIRNQGGSLDAVRRFIDVLERDDAWLRPFAAGGPWHEWTDYTEKTYYKSHTLEDAKTEATKHHSPLMIKIFASKATEAAEEVIEAAAKAEDAAEMAEDGAYWAEKAAAEEWKAAIEKVQAADAALEMEVEAKKTADEAMEEAIEAKKRATEAKKAAATAKAGKTKKAADEARQAAVGAEDAAIEAEVAAERAEEDAEIARRDAEDAQETADEAKEAADEAKEAADEAKLAADDAREAADEAKVAADEAKVAADNANHAAEQYSKSLCEVRDIERRLDNWRKRVSLVHAAALAVNEELLRLELVAAKQREFADAVEVKDYTATAIEAAETSRTAAKKAFEAAARVV
jgi:hypothetical protein